MPELEFWSIVILHLMTATLVIGVILFQNYMMQHYLFKHGVDKT